MMRTILRRRGFFQLSGAAWLAGRCPLWSGLPAWYIQETLDRTPVSRPLAANDKPGIAVIGCGRRGLYLAKRCARFGDLVAVCDVDEAHLANAAPLAPWGAAYNDFRRVLELKTVAVIFNATPDHWHTLINLAAMRAGKDVYSEKPLTLTVEEGRRLVRTAEQTKRILQTGLQQRSDARFRLAVELVRNHRIGRLKHIIIGLPKGGYGGPFPPSPVPPGLDWDFWLGPARKVDYVKERCHFNYRHWYDYSSGPLTDWGCHHNDIALWALGLDDSGPLSVQGISHLDPVPGGYDVHSQFTVQYQYANGVTHICVTMFTTQFGDTPLVMPTSMVNGLEFQDTDGWIRVTRDKMEASRPELLSEPLRAGAERVRFSDDHMKDFFECIRARKQPICPAEVGHRAASLGHIGAICLRLGGRPLRWDPANERFEGDGEANQYLAREQRPPWTYAAVL